MNHNDLVNVWSITIEVNLSCTGNDAVITHGSVNTVGGQRLGSCQNV